MKLGISVQNYNNNYYYAIIIITYKKINNIAPPTELYRYQ